jgi:tetrahydromethanopterin S-methyltransferase subunit F
MTQVQTQTQTQTQTQAHKYAKTTRNRSTIEAHIIQSKVLGVGIAARRIACGLVTAIAMMIMMMMMRMKPQPTDGAAVRARGPAGIAEIVATAGRILTILTQPWR